MPVFDPHSVSAKSLAVRLGALVALTPFAVDTYLPAIPAIANDMHASVNEVSVTVPLFLVGFALGQLIGGPLSDRFGRKPIAYLGLLVFFVSSCLMLFSITLEQFYAMRVIQAIGGGFATVVSSAIVRDLYSGRESARVFSMIALVMLVAPLVAPAMGAMILVWHEWHGIFFFLALYSMVLFALVKWFVPETVSEARQREAKQKSIGSMVTNYAQVLRHLRPVGFLLAQGFASSVLFVYITESPFILMETFQVSESAFPFYFGVVVLGVMFFNRVNMGLLKRYEPRQIVLVALVLQAVMALLLMGYASLTEASLYMVLLGQFFVIGVLGMVTPNVQAIYMDFFPNISGTANALMGSSIFAVGGLMGVLMSQIHNGSLSQIFMLVAGLSLMSLLSLVWLASVREVVHPISDNDAKSDVE